MTQPRETSRSTSRVTPPGVTSRRTSHPGWYHNIAAHPGRVEIEIGDRTLKVTPVQLSGAQRDNAWQRIIAAQPRYARYQAKTDRLLPVIRLTPAAPDTGGA